MRRFNQFFCAFLLSLLLFPATLIVQDASADQTKKPHFWWGPKVGLDLATPTVDQNSIQTQFKSNAQVGIFFQFGRKLYLQPEFYYAMHKETNTFTGTTSQTSVNSLKVPVLLGLRLINLGIVSAHVMAGPEATFFLNESNPVASTISRKNSSYNFQLGAGADLLGFITVDLRYAFKMDNTMGTQIQQLDLKSTVNATVGLKFR